jgi:hypothetical protein
VHADLVALHHARLHPHAPLDGERRPEPRERARGGEEAWGGFGFCFLGCFVFLGCLFLLGGLWGGEGGGLLGVLGGWGEGRV